MPVMYKVHIVSFCPAFQLLHGHLVGLGALEAEVDLGYIVNG